MLNGIITLAILTLSFTANAAMIDLGSITRDTSTGLDWLDLTETNGRSYTDISSQLGAGQEFDGWRYATVDEVQQLWKNFGLIEGTGVYISKNDTSQYNGFINAVSLLGNTYNEWDSNYDFGAAGFTANVVSYNTALIIVNGMHHTLFEDEAYVLSPNVSSNRNMEALFMGSYLVAPSAVPIPTAAWLFSTALIGMMGLKRKK